MELNKVTFTVGTSPKNIELIIMNFEHGLIDEPLFAEVLELFQRKPGEFGYSPGVSV